VEISKNQNLRRKIENLLEYSGILSWSLLEKRNLGVAKSIIKYHEQSKCVLAIPKQQFF
jgi:hypothetical protein